MAAPTVTSIGVGAGLPIAVDADALGISVEARDDCRRAGWQRIGHLDARLAEGPRRRQ